MDSSLKNLDFDKLSKYISSSRRELATLFGECRAVAKIPTPSAFLEGINRAMKEEEKSPEESLDTTLEEILECCETTEDLPAILHRTPKNISRANSSTEVSEPEYSTAGESQAQTFEEVVEFFKNTTEQYAALRSKLTQNIGNFQKYETKLKELRSFLVDLEKSLPDERKDNSIESLTREEEAQIEELRKNVDILGSAKIQISYSENDHEQLSRILDLVMPIAKQLLVNLE